MVVFKADSKEVIGLGNHLWQGATVRAVVLFGATANGDGRIAVRVTDDVEVMPIEGGDGGRHQILLCYCQEVQGLGSEA